jgi:hypothetical protein
MKLIQLLANLFSLPRPREESPAPRRRKGRTPLIDMLHPKQRQMVLEWSGSTSDLARYFNVTWTTAHRLRIMVRNESVARKGA